MEYDYFCPNCGKKLIFKNKSLICENKHCFDVAKTGYVNLLLANQKNSFDPGDNKEMIAARVAVMRQDYYKALAEGIARLLKEYNPKSIIDVGCGIGYVPNVLKSAFPQAKVSGTDISRNAIDTAAKNYKDIPFAVASSARLPLSNESMDAVICAFAPVFREEFLRVLKKGGVFVRVIPDVYHLYKLKSALYATPRTNDLDPIEIEGFRHVKTEEIKSDFLARGEILRSVVKMTPYYYHTSPADLEKLFSKDELLINTEFNVRLYLKN